ncbi:hypothetical protein GOBAR_DD04814 [Gossypium barbadense]|nr:hypothetical protein GOBAR_DD04814 [Gossypium barbadense]
MSDGIARSRLVEERKAWRKNHPHGFVAKPETRVDGSVDLMVWHCVIPGKKGGWRPSITVKQILVGIQDLLDQPNATDAAQTEGHQLYVSNPNEYRKRVQQQVLQYPQSL